MPGLEGETPEHACGLDDVIAGVNCRGNLSDTDSQDVHRPGTKRTEQLFFRAEQAINRPRRRACLPPDFAEDNA